MNAAKEIWQEMLPTLETEVNAISFDVWIKPLEPLDIDDDRLILLAPTEGNRDAVNSSLRPLIKKVLSSVNPLLTDITLLLPADVSRMKGADFSPEELKEDGGEEEAPVPKVDAMLINPRYTFDNFVVGECNRFAVAAARRCGKPGSEVQSAVHLRWRGTR